MKKGNKVAGGGVNRRHSVEFKIAIAQKMLAGESCSTLSREHGLPRSMMYRWRDAYRESGAGGLRRPLGRPPGRAPAAPAGGRTEEKLRRRIAELERKVGRQEVENDFLRRVFKRVSELPKAHGRGGKASTPKSDG